MLDVLVTHRKKATEQRGLDLSYSHSNRAGPHLDFRS